MSDPASADSMVVSAVMVPHPPIILPNIGKGEEKKIADIDAAYRQAAKVIADSAPDTVVIVSPHAPSWLDYMQITAGKQARGDMSEFGDAADAFDIQLDEPLARTITELAAQSGIPTGNQGPKNSRLDHGTMIPLYYLQQVLPKETRYMRMGIGSLDNLDHYQAGQLIAQAAGKLNRRVAIVGSGDLSHCQKAGTHYGLKACGPEYDARIMEIMARGDFGALLEISDKEAEEAMVCGQKPFCVMAGAMDGYRPESHSLAHSAIFGVGYGINTYSALQPDESRHFYEQAKEKQLEDYNKRTATEDPWVQLARQTIEKQIAGHPLSQSALNLPEDMMKEQAGVFVSLHKNGTLRGCIGTTAPTARNIAAEIRQNAISAATRDPRFIPVEERELPALEISVDVLKEPEPIDSLDLLDPVRYGVIVTKGNRRGLLLPNLEGVESVEQQVAIAKQKAGLRADEPGCSLERFEVIRHH